MWSPLVAPVTSGRCHQRRHAPCCSSSVRGSRSNTLPSHSPSTFASAVAPCSSHAAIIPSTCGNAGCPHRVRHWVPRRGRTGFPDGGLLLLRRDYFLLSRQRDLLSTA